MANGCRARIWLFMAVMSLAGGCTTWQTYGSRALPAKEEARIGVGFTRGRCVVRTVNGRRLRKHPRPGDTLAVRPGQCVLGVDVTWSNGFSERVELPAVLTPGGLYGLDLYEFDEGHERTPPGWTVEGQRVGPLVTVSLRRAPHRPRGRVMEVEVADVRGRAAGTWRSGEHP